MAKIEQYSRIINHSLTTAGQTFTVPVSNDHTDETWLASDLYIGEFGVNLTDDKVYVRTNNGILQIATGTSSGSTASQAAVFVFNSPNIQISSTYSADAVTRRSGYFTDLGSSTLRWKDLYLGGSSTNYATINVNSGLSLKESSNGIIVTNGIINDNSPIGIHTTSQNSTKDRGLHLNSRSTTFVGAGNIESAFISSVSASMSNCSSTVVIGGQNVKIADSLNAVVHLGLGYNKFDYDTETIYAGKKLAIRGVADDGSGQYDRSDWITGQELLRTSDALTTDIVTIPWVGTASGGNIVQVKAYLIGTVIDSAAYAYHAEIIGCYTINDVGTITEVGVPILNASSANWPSASPDVEMSADSSGVYVSVTGVGTTTIQWLCSYSYHRLINIV